MLLELSVHISEKSYLPTTVKLTVHIFLRNHIFQPSIAVCIHASKADSAHISEKSYLLTI